MSDLSGLEKERIAVQVCVARYNEKTNWLSQPEFSGLSKIIYNKGPSQISTKTPADCVIAELPNVGRECHTFLHHIVSNYDDLANVTIFLPGSCMDDGKVCKTEDLMKLVQSTQDTIISGAWYPDVRRKFEKFSIDSWKGTNDANENLINDNDCKPAEKSPFGRWYKDKFGDLKIEVVCFTSIFAVSRSHILQNSKAHYENFLSCLDKHCNPEEGHFIERSWVAIFAPIPENCLIAPRPLIPKVRRILAPSIKGISFLDALAVVKNGYKKDVAAQNIIDRNKKIPSSSSSGRLISGHYSLSTGFKNNELRDIHHDRNQYNNDEIFPDNRKKSSDRRFDSYHNSTVNEAHGVGDTDAEIAPIFRERDQCSDIGRYRMNTDSNNQDNHYEDHLTNKKSKRL